MKQYKDLSKKQKNKNKNKKLECRSDLYKQEQRPAQMNSGLFGDKRFWVYPFKLTDADTDCRNFLLQMIRSFQLTKMFSASCSLNTPASINGFRNTCNSNNNNEDDGCDDNKKSKYSVFARLTRLLCIYFPYIINDFKSFGYFILLLPIGGKLLS